jgi:hypothetical protein
MQDNSWPSSFDFKVEWRNKDGGSWSVLDSYNSATCLQKGLQLGCSKNAEVKLTVTCKNWISKWSVSRDSAA